MVVILLKLEFVEEWDLNISSDLGVVSYWIYVIFYYG